jgi:tetratricopeptide (TPR) repeat protein
MDVQSGSTGDLRSSRTILCAVLLTIAAVALYAASWSHQLVWDDEYLITSHRGVAGMESLWQAFTPDYYRDLFYRGEAFFRPITTLTFAVEYALWGKNPAGYHVTNTLLYGACVLLTFFFLRRLTRSDALALLASIFFVVHAPHAEAVLWVKCRAEMMAFLGYLGALLCFLTYLEQSRSRVERGIWMLLSVALFLIALASKMTAITLPAAAVLTVWWRDDSEAVPRRLFSTWPLWSVAAVHVVVSFAVLNRPAVTATFEPGDFGTLPTQWRVLASLWEYVRITICPGELAVQHVPPWPNGLWIIFAWPLLAVVAVSGLLLILFRSRTGWIGYGIAWFGIALAPSLNLIRISGRPVAEQRLFLPSLGACLAGAALLQFLWRRHGELRSRRLRSSMAVMVGVLIVGIHLFSVFRYQPVWKTEESFWQQSLRRVPDSAVAHDRLAVYLARNGRAQEALHYLNQARSLDPTDIYVRLHEGVVYHLVGDTTSSVRVLEDVVRERPDLPEGWHALAEVYQALARFQQEAEAMRRVVELRPDRGEYQNSWAEALIRAGSPDTAIPILRRALQQRKPRWSWWQNLADAYSLIGDGTAAIQAYRESVRLDPANASAYAALGVEYGKRGDLDSAVRELSEAVRLKPREPKFLGNLAFAHLQRKEYKTAAEYYTVVADMGEASATDLFYLGVARWNVRDVSGAQQALEEAVRLDSHHAPAAEFLKRIRTMEGPRP